jgi:hypothetical protein
MTEIGIPLVKRISLSPGWEMAWKLFECGVVMEIGRLGVGEWNWECVM